MSTPPRATLGARRLFYSLEKTVTDDGKTVNPPRLQGSRAVLPSRAALVAARLRNQHLAGSTSRGPADVVAQLCAVQAQDYIGAKWALGVRLRGFDDAAVEAAFDAGTILRTHVLRPTWHFVTPADIRWMLTLTAPRVHAVSAYYYRQHGLDPKTLSRAHRVIESELAGKRWRTRTELAAALRKRGIEASGPRLGLLTLHAELEQVMCSGPVRGRQQTYALVDDRAPLTRARSPGDPAAHLASRYFASHGPATVRDFAWWSGLTVAQATRGIAAATPALESRVVEGHTYWAASWAGRAQQAGAASGASVATFLLPNYDEYLIAYKDRQLLRPAGGPERHMSLKGPDTFAHPLIVEGAMVGVWRRRVSGAATRIEVVPYLPLSAAQSRAVDAAVKRLTAFIGAGVTVAPRGVPSTGSPA